MSPKKIKKHGHPGIHTRLRLASAFAKATADKLAGRVGEASRRGKVVTRRPKARLRLPAGG